jgi:hypothetical protein
VVRSHYGLVPASACSCLAPRRPFQVGSISLVGATIETPSAWLAEPKGLAEVRAQIAELTLENAAYAGRASCVRCAVWHVPDSVVHICSVPHVMQPNTCHATQRAPAFSIDSECRACYLSCQTTHLRTTRARIFVCVYAWVGAARLCRSNVPLRRQYGLLLQQWTLKAPFEEAPSAGGGGSGGG